MKEPMVSKQFVAGIALVFVASIGAAVRADEQPQGGRAQQDQQVQARYNIFVM